MQSKFMEWFVQQHGPRERGLLSTYSDQRLRDAIRAGQDAAAALACRERWDARRESALYAWQAAQPPQEAP